MKRNALIVSLVVTVVGFIAVAYGNNASTVDASGMVQDSAWLPVGALLIVAGIIALIVIGIQALVATLRKK